MISSRYPLPEKPRQKRAVIQDMVRPLKKWLLRHRHNPYPTKAEKVQLALGSNMTLVQVINCKVVFLMIPQKNTCKPDHHSSINLDNSEE